ncbi:Rhamnan synthesis F [Desulfitobacterium hafniense DCB-2]|uniref:Rhamnan synthesis F n=1 Tax=Desulfitobacterium hafniense (strain DSM 10664 / DCB-2) TaxID=272564 RepID=B8FVR3_DESHD|nr:rhamnan synthesis F family protein [Desulfitobacterium hafniense]ACL22465.1 Rhamnan synthesis F [Desulfitobacterium hafniense DCB-2]
MNRLAIFVFWEKEGIVREYITVYLKGIKEVANKIYVVVNGEINKNGREILEETVGAEVLVRPNEGVDFWAYKTALDAEGEEISEYDEVILCNCSCYGPVYPFREMFDEMGQKNLDFWGITEWPLNEAGYEGTWILSYFMVFRPRMFLSDVWKLYWENLCPVYSREECILLHETKFTQYFADKGFTYDVYCHNTPDYIDLTIEAPDKLVIDQRCPIIKRKAFCAEYNRFLSYHRGSASKRVFDYIQKNDLYDTNIILDDLLATQHYAFIKNCLHLNYFLPSDYVVKPLKRQPKVVVCFHVYYEDLLDSCFHYMQSIPQFADIVITTPKKELVGIIEEKIKSYELNNTTIKVINARGRAESAFLVATKDFILDYDYACIVHDKKSSFLRPGCVGVEFGLQNLDALLATSAYVENILSIFEDNPRIGALEPVHLLHANFRDLYGGEWGANYKGTEEFLKRAGIDLLISPDVPPLAPMGAMFWFRPICMKRILDMEWEYEDFPEEPLPLDGSLIHIIERAYPFIVQDAGYLTGWVSTIEDAEIHLTNISYLYRDVNIKLHNSPDKSIFVPIVSRVGANEAIKSYLKKRLHPTIWTVLKKIYYKMGGKPIG